MVALSCGIKMSTVDHLVLSQSTPVTDSARIDARAVKTSETNFSNFCHRCVWVHIYAD